MVWEFQYFDFLSLPKINFISTILLRNFLYWLLQKNISKQVFVFFISIFFRQIDNTSYNQHALRLKKMYMQSLEHHQNTNQHSHSLFTAELGTRLIRVCADLCARLLALMDLRQPWLRALAILRNPGSTEFLNTRLLSLYKLLTVIGCLRVLGCLIPYVWSGLGMQTQK